MMAVLPSGPILGLCSLPMAVRCLIARFLAPRLRRCVHPVAQAIRDLVFHVELPRRLVVFWRWEHRLWLAGAKPIRPSLVWPVIHERSAKHFRGSSADVGKPARASAFRPPDSYVAMSTDSRRLSPRLRLDDCSAKSARSFKSTA
jgi:hypothetical protein